MWSGYVDISALKVEYNSRGYPWAYVPGRPGRRWLLHLLVMENELGRRLEEGEEVHHKDGNPLNYAIENLELTASRAEHAAKHRKDAPIKTCPTCKQPFEAEWVEHSGKYSRNRYCSAKCSPRPWTWKNQSAVGNKGGG